MDDPTAAIPPEMLAAHVYRVHGAEVLGALRARTRDPVSAEDHLQEALLRLHREAMAGRAPDDPRAWLHRVAANLATSTGRRRQVAVRHAPALVERRVVASPEDVAVRHEEDADLRRALGTLSPLDREVVMLAASGLPGPEIGDRFGVSAIAIRTRLCRARARLRQELLTAGPAPIAT